MSGGPHVREYLTGVTKMTEQRNSRIALLAVVMLLSGAFIGLVVSDNASAAKYDINGFVRVDNNINNMLFPFSFYWYIDLYIS